MAKPTDLMTGWLSTWKQLWLGNRRNRCDRPLDSFAGHDEPNEKINIDAGKNGNGAAATA